MQQAAASAICSIPLVIYWGCSKQQWSRGACWSIWGMTHLASVIRAWQRSWWQGRCWKCRAVFCGTWSSWNNGGQRAFRGMGGRCQRATTWGFRMLANTFVRTYWRQVINTCAIVEQVPMNEEVAKDAASCQHWQVCDWWILWQSDKGCSLHRDRYDYSTNRGANIAAFLMIGSCPWSALRPRRIKKRLKKGKSR